MAEQWRRWLRYRPSDERTRVLVDVVAEAAEDGEQGGDAEFVVELARVRAALDAMARAAR